MKSKLESDGSLSERTPLSAAEITDLLEVCLASNYFSFRGKYYRLADGVAMGSPVSSVVANLFMEDLEEVAIRTAGQHVPKVWE